MKKKHGFVWLASVVLLMGALWGCPSGGRDEGATDGGGVKDDGRGKANGVKFSPLTASLGKGVSQMFDAAVTGNPNDTVIWSLEGNRDPSTVLEGEGRQRVLRIGGDETAAWLTLRAEMSGGRYGTALVYISSTAEGRHQLTTHGITVSPGTIEVAPGGTKLFTAKLTGTEEPVHVTWGQSDRRLRRNGGNF
jgi:hypothetical protein